MDRSNGYEGVAPEFLSRRGSGPLTGVGVRGTGMAAYIAKPGRSNRSRLRAWFSHHRGVVAEGLDVFAVDAAPACVQAFRRNLPNTPVVCEAVQNSTFFHRTFDGVLAWGLVFLLSREDQRRLI